MGDADKPASCIFGKITEGVSAFVVFTEVHGYKYSSFYLFDELFCTFHIIFSHPAVHWEQR